MKKLLNTLYLTKDSYYLSRDGENIVILDGDKIIQRYPIHILENIICFNYTGCSPGVIKLCLENNISICFLTPQGQFCGRIIGKTNGNVLLRKKQYKISEEEESLEFVKNIIYAKAYNSRKLLLRSKRDHPNEIDKVLVENTIKNIEELMENIKVATSKDSVRGYEGNIAREYFSVFDQMILKKKDVFYLNERSKRPPKDRVNAMLSFLYTLLTHQMQSALESVGIDSYVGFFHTDRPGRMSMALDLIEELRAYMVDRLVLSMINLSIITEKDFEIKESNGVYLNESGKKKIISYWQERKQDEIEHPFLQEKIKIGLLPYVQALLLNRYLRGDLCSYPPFMLKGW